MQKSLDQTQIPISLLKSYELVEYCGYAPMKLGSYKAAVEIFVNDFESIYLPIGKAQVGDRRKIITLSFGEEATSACCAAGLATTLAKCWDALVYCDGFVSSKQLLIVFNELLPQARFEARQTPHKLLLDAIAERLPHFARTGNHFIYIPLGHCIRGFFISPRRDSFDVNILFWPVVAYSERLHVSFCPSKLDIQNCYGSFYKPSNPPSLWNYQDGDCADIIVELAISKMEPYFELVDDPATLASELFDQFHDSSQIYELEKTGMACAAVGHYDDALTIFDRLKHINANWQHFEYIVAMDERCGRIAGFIRENRIAVLDAQLAKWKAITIGKLRLGAISKKVR